MVVLCVVVVGLGVVVVLVVVGGLVIGLKSQLSSSSAPGQFFARLQMFD